MKKFDVITIGGATQDISFYTQEGELLDNKKDVLRQKLLAFEYGAKIKIDKTYFSFGGGASNSAVNLSRLGLNVASYIFVGDDKRGKDLTKNLKDQGVNISLVKKQKREESGVSFVLIGAENERIIFTHRGANSNLNLGKRDLRKLRKTEWVYITSLSGKWQSALRDIFSVDGVKFAWNPGSVQLQGGVKSIGKYIKKTDMLFLNKDEAIELVISDKKYKGKDAKFLNNVKNLLKAVKEMGPEMVVITSGKKGADCYDGKKIYHQAILEEKVRVDTTGVGDAFNSSIIAGLKVFNGDKQKAMRLGVMNTSSSIAKQGAQNGLLTKEDIKKVL